MGAAMLKNIVYGSWWVALCAAALTLLSWKDAGGEGIIISLPVFVLGATLMVYNLNMLSGLDALRSSGTASPRHLWCMGNEEWMKAYLGAGAVLALPSFFMLHPAAWWLLAPAVLAAMLYVFPVMRGMRLREVGIWKIFLIATVWAVVTVGLPVTQLDNLPDWKDFTWLLAERWLFIFAITVPFDVRDLSTDAAKGVSTLPSMLGWRSALLVSGMAMAMFVLLAMCRLGIDAFMGLVPAVVAAFALIGFTRPGRTEMYYSFWLEGTMLVLAFGGLLHLCF
jgi:4-hydroxybenzoate polyprenyltransferase